MSPNPPSPSNKRQSGNPAKQAEINLTVKQQREQKRQEKLAEYQRQLAKRRRSKIVWWVVGGTAAVAVIALVAASIIFAPPPPKEYTAGSEGVTIEGVEEFTHTTEHVEGTVDYDQSPPAGGPHAAIWLNCGIYSEQVPNENAVHSMEHGAIWVTYNPDDIAGDDLDTLKGELPSSYVILSPYPDLDAPIALSGWNHQLKVDSTDDDRIGEFFEEYWRSQNVPEPNAACTGALDGPGKQR
ncbi:DUF3105 domain-containing protein [Microbacterium sp. C7(2022)]|uniref:DUF3105 domain-containing protein n=1 Tax=Microbacterium sp. C7(2022) TaxID=2992759 RepID=UPI00237BD9AA|nr:DUF3105 domain-containing protein [Microbacterium sp. C7(2022)]MDE0546080.1 DUF3105 domain-containing protein [Microbacterium sp. C7(2022)]